MTLAAQRPGSAGRQTLRWACGAVLSGLLTLAGPAAAAVGLSPCWLKGVPHEARCGQVSRALDPAQPGGTRIDVHFAVLPALARNKMPDPVLFIAGGPGQSAIALAGPVSQMLARFGNRRDIVLVDQRGTGRSAPLVCDDGSADPSLRDGIDPQRQAQRALQCLHRLEGLPYGDLRQYTTSIAVADLEAVRLALAAPRVNLIGASYGTRVALEYLRQFPTSTRRLVLDGVVPADMLLPQASAQDAQAAFDALLQWCDADAVCHGRYPNLRATWQALLLMLPRDVTLTHPLTGRTESVLLTGEMLLGLMRGPLYVPALGAALPAALDAAARGQWTPLVGLSSALGGRGGDDALAQGMHFSVVCSEDLPRHAVEAAPARDFGAGLAPLYQQICAAWPHAEPPADFFVVRESPVAVLLLSGGIDPVTPPRHGRRVADALGSLARHEVVPNAGHGLLSLPCIRDAVFRFVDADTDAAALEVDTGCALDIPRPPPFRPSAAAPQP